MIIARLLEQLEELGFKGEEIKEWLPVYGVVYGVLNIKRELKPLELGKLKQSIFSYENRLTNNIETEPETVPRLLTK